MDLVISLVLNALALMAVAYLLGGFRIRSFWSALMLAIVLALVNTFVRPVALLLALPINLITLGLFTFVVNAAMLKLSSFIVRGVSVDGWKTAIIAALLLSLISVFLPALFSW